MSHERLIMLARVTVRIDRYFNCKTSVEALDKLTGVKLSDVLLPRNEFEARGGELNVVRFTKELLTRRRQGPQRSPRLGAKD